MASVQTGLSRKLLTRVLSVYFFLTFIVTVGQIFTEYLSTKSHIESELQTLKNTFSTSLTRAIWEVNIPQAQSIAEGLMELPIVTGVQIRDENGEYIADLGVTIAQIRAPFTSGELEDHDGGLFSYSFPLIFEFSNRASTVGDVTLYSNFDIIFGRIEVGIFFLIGNAIVKTAFLVFLFMTAFRRMLSDPLMEVTQKMSAFNPDNPEQSKIYLTLDDENELRLLQYSYNQVIDDLIVSQQQLKNTQGELQRVNKKLDDQNLLLEQEVAKKTASLSQIMLDLERQKDELIANQRELRQENENRQYIENVLRDKNKELAQSMEHLKLAQDQLLESERMASFLDEAEQTTSLLLTNLNRASDLITSFKQVAVDQTSEAERVFNLNNYLHEILQSLGPSFKHTQHKVNVQCPDELYIRSAPGIIALIITNMIMNSIIHGFENKTDGHIDIEVLQDGEDVVLTYQDDGCGIPADQLGRLFDAFFTTKRGQGGSGLGTHIMYNLVTQALDGNIEASSEPGQGLRYEIRFPART